MAKTKVIGTTDLIGATVVSVDWNEMTLEKDGRTFLVELEYSDDYHSMCEGDCCCYSSPSGYFIARENVE